MSITVLILSKQGTDMRGMSMQGTGPSIAYARNAYARNRFSFWVWAEWVCTDEYARNRFSYCFYEERVCTEQVQLLLMREMNMHGTCSATAFAQNDCNFLIPGQIIFCFILLCIKTWQTVFRLLCISEKNEKRGICLLLANGSLQNVLRDNTLGSM
jgi:hypothetical protein